LIGCGISALATAERLTAEQSTTSADIYRLMDATPDRVHNSALYSKVSTSESHFTEQAFSLAADRSGTVGPGDRVTLTATMTSLKTGTPLTARSHEIDVSRLLDDARISTITATAGSAERRGDAIVWSSDGPIPSGAVVTVTLQAIVTGGGDRDLRAVIDGPTGSTTFPFDLPAGPRSNCQTVPAPAGPAGVPGILIWINRQLFIAGDVAAMGPATFASTMGPCAVVLAVREPAPVIPDAGGPYRIDEGAASLALDSTGTVAGSAAEYRWDVNDDGAVDITGAAPVLNAQRLAELGLGDGPASKNVSLNVTEGSVSRAASTIITVNNLPPAVTVARPAGDAIAGRPVSITLTADDPWLPDVALPDYRIDWGDGTVETVGTSTPRHGYREAGSYRVVATVTDKDGAVSAPARLTLVVDPAGPAVPSLPATGDGGVPRIAGVAGLLLLAAGTVLLMASGLINRVRGSVS
jgi:PKD domain